MLFLHSGQRKGVLAEVRCCFCIQDSVRVSWRDYDVVSAFRTALGCPGRSAMLFLHSGQRKGVLAGLRYSFCIQDSVRVSWRDYGVTRSVCPGSVGRRCGSRPGSGDR